MLNDVKYKSSLTLTLQTPESKPQHPIVECFDDNDTIVHDKLCKINQSNDEMPPFIVISSNHLSNANRTYSRMESFNESSASLPSTMSSCSNETIIPIKYLIHDENSDCNQIEIGKIAEISPKYCCTLEVKFVW